MQTPRFFYFTDDKRGRDPLEMAQILPSDVGIVFRHYEAPDRAKLARQLSRVCKKRGIFLSIAGNPTLAYQIGADGVHLPEYMIPRLPMISMRYPKLAFSSACHSAASLMKSNNLGVAFAFISPLFPTRSHPGARHLPVHSIAPFLRKLEIPVLGLGGITPERWRQINQMGLQGFGAIDLFESD